MDTDYQIAELKRRLANVMLLGTVEFVDYERARARVRIGSLLTAFLPWATSRAGGDRDWAAPEVGEQVIVISPMGDPAQGVIMGAIFQNDFPANGDRATLARTDFEDGASVEYDRALHRYTLALPDAAAEVRILTGGKVTVVADGDITLQSGGDIDIGATGNVTLTGAEIHLNT